MSLFAIFMALKIFGMKRCLVCVLLMVYSISHAQDLIINAPDLPGYYYTAYQADTLGWRGGDSGIDKIWDFSSVRLKDDGVAYYFQPVNDNPYKAYFPHANYMLYTLNPYNPVLFIYRDENMVGEIGQVSFDTDRVYFEWMNNDGTDTIVQYPIYYGKKKFNGPRFFQSSPKDSLRNDAKLNHMSKIDGEGTIITPDHKSYRVLREKNSIFQYGKVYHFINGKSEYLYSHSSSTTCYKWKCNELPFPFIYSTWKTRQVWHYPDKTIMQDTTIYGAEYCQTGTVMLGSDYNEVHLKVVRDEGSNLVVAFTCSTNYPGYLIINDMSGACVLKKPVTPEGSNNETIQELETANLGNVVKNSW